MTANWEWKEHFVYLMELRDSGVTNMFGAAPYLSRQFNLERKKSREILINWMENFQEIFMELN